MTIVALANSHIQNFSAFYIISSKSCYEFIGHNVIFKTLAKMAKYLARLKSYREVLEGGKQERDSYHTRYVSGRGGGRGLNVKPSVLANVLKQHRERR